MLLIPLYLLLLNVTKYLVEKSSCLFKDIIITIIKPKISIPLNIKQL
jgi:hypothetical protein